MRQIAYLPIHWVHGYSVVARASVQTELLNARLRLVKAEEDYALYSAGRQAFQSAEEPNSGVGQFHDKRGYLSPIYFQTRDPRVHVYFGDTEAFGIFSSYKEARNFWVKQPSSHSALTGKNEIYYLATLGDEITQDRQIIRDLPYAATVPFAARFTIYLESAKYPPMLLLFFGLIADVSGGVLRMLVDLLRKRSRRTSGPLTS